jgi:hypothetical protein
MVCKMLRVGYTSNTAIDKMYSVYSTRLSVTNILRQMRKDNNTGGNPLLRSTIFTFFNYRFLYYYLLFIF